MLMTLIGLIVRPAFRAVNRTAAIDIERVATQISEPEYDHDSRGNLVSHEGR